MRRSGAVGTTILRPILMLGSWPLFTASYALLRLSPTALPASSTGTVSFSLKLPHSAGGQFRKGKKIKKSDLKKGVNSLATIGTTAPFVGLLGTVVGVINAFTGIAATGSGGIGAVSAGIAEALVETALGLVVAIPAVWFYNYLTGRLDYFNVEMDNSSSELVDYFIKKTA